MEQLDIVEILGGRGVPWSNREKPSLNHWYRCIGSERDYWKIVKDYHAPERNTTYYKIVEYYNGDVLYCGHTISEIRQIIRNNTYRMVI